MCFKMTELVIDGYFIRVKWICGGEKSTYVHALNHDNDCCCLATHIRLEFKETGSCVTALPFIYVIDEYLLILTTSQ